MKGVFVKDMQMPKDCPLCPMAHYDSLNHFKGCEIVPGKRYAMTFDGAYANSDHRPEWCPLIELAQPNDSDKDETEPGDPLIQQAVNCFSAFIDAMFKMRNENAEAYDESL